MTITSVASKFPNYPPGSVTLGVLNPIPVLGTVTPSGFSEGTTTVTVNGSQFVYGAQIMWNGAAVPTTFVSGTQLVAAIAAPNPGHISPAREQSQSRVGELRDSPGGGGPGQVVLTLQPARRHRCAREQQAEYRAHGQRDQ